MAVAARFGRASAFGRAPSPVTPMRAAAVKAVPAPEITTAPVPVALKGFHFGFLTLCLMAVLIVIYVYEMRLSGSTGSEVNDRYFIALGGVSWKYLTQQHEWWRFFTAPWLHADTSHIAGNGIALIITGWRLERLIGRAWLSAAYIVGAIGGTIGSLALTSIDVSVSLGASGAIMGLVGLLFTLSFHADAEKRAWSYRRYALFVLIPALLPSVTSDGATVDIGAHFGGAIASIMLGFALLATWPEDGAKPPFAWAAGLFAALGMAATAVAFASAWQHFPSYAREASLFAPRNIVADYEKANRSEELVRRYPNDPLAHLVRAMHLYDANDMTGALSEIRTGLDEKRALAVYYPPQMTFHLRLMLVLGLLAEERVDDAHSEAQPICPTIRDPARWPGRGKSGEQLAAAIAYARDNHACD